MLSIGLLLNFTPWILPAPPFSLLFGYHVTFQAHVLVDGFLDFEHILGVGFYCMTLDDGSFLWGSLCIISLFQVLYERLSSAAQPS